MMAIKGLVCILKVDKRWTGNWRRVYKR